MKENITMPSLTILIKPASGSCNMRCSYCFYADELKNREEGLLGRMSADTMHAIVDRVADSGCRECNLAFQGGEPTLIGIDFYKDLMEYIKNHPDSEKIRFYYAIQTNGYEIDDEWAKFWADNHFLVGISLDGNKDIHDRYRKDAKGNGTFNRVMASIRLLEKYKVEYNILTVVTAASARAGQKIYHFFQKNHLNYQQYIECLDPIGETPGQYEYSLTPKRYEAFLKSIFDAWYLDMKAGKYVYNRYFENLMMIMAGGVPESCNMRGICGKQWVIEADGSTYPCDFYALDSWLLGNVNTDSLADMDKKREELGFIEWSRKTDEECRACPWFRLCRNGCRRNREPVSADGGGRNYFCSAYKGFFEYVYPRLMEVYQMYVRGM